MHRPKNRGGLIVSDGHSSGLIQNNTDFSVKLGNKLRKLRETYNTSTSENGNGGKTWRAILKYYQYVIKTIMSDPEYGVGMNGNSRGMLIYHDMGTGKTRLAVAVAMAMWETRSVVIMLPRSLQKNFKNTVSEVMKMLNPATSDDEIKRVQIKFLSFVSMDAYNSATQLTRTYTGMLENKLLIVDEAHNFFRAIINSSGDDSNAKRIYNIIMGTKNLRLLFLTGTPCSKDPFEIVPCFNMLSGTDLLPTQYEEFYRLYINKEKGTIINREYLANRLTGLVSHVSPKLPMAGEANVKSAGDLGWFPTELPVKVEYVEMGYAQYRQYRFAREKELMEGKSNDGFSVSMTASISSKALSLPGADRKIMKSYFVKSRMLSTYYSDRGITEAPKLKLIAAAAKACQGPILAYSQFVESGLRPLGVELESLGFVKFEPSAAIEAPVIIATPNEAPTSDVGDVPATGGDPSSDQNRYSGQNWDTYLNWEFQSYLLSECVRDILSGGSKSPEIQECISHWMMSFTSDNVRAPWKLFAGVSMSDAAMTDMATIPKERIDRALAFIKDSISKPPKTDLKLVVFDQKYTGRTTIVIHGDKCNISYSIGNDIFNNLVRVATANKCSDPIKAIAICVLRYKSVVLLTDMIIPADGASNIPDYTAFSSPLWSHTKYCSPFADTDSIFGSLGPFKDLDLIKYPGRWNITPPPTEYMIDWVTNKIMTTIPMASSDLKITYVISGLNTARIASLKRTPYVDSVTEQSGNYMIDMSGGGMTRGSMASGGADTAPKYAIISGDVANTDRDIIVNVFNSKANYHGDLIKAILVSKTGAEGLDLKWIRETHQIEPYWDKARDQQLIARAVRLGSHDGLPEDERIVQPYLYIGMPNKDLYDTLPKESQEVNTIDEIFFIRANDKWRMVESMRQLLKSSCIECEIFQYGNCRTCMPTNAPLFHSDPKIDAGLPDPCIPHKETNVAATPIELDGVTYYSAVDDGETKYYEYNKEFDGYTLVNDDDIIDRLAARP